MTSDEDSISLNSTALSNEADDGDHAIDDTDIPDILSPPSEWRGSFGRQKPLKDINQEGQDELWAEALTKGASIKQWLGEVESICMAASSANLLCFRQVRKPSRKSSFRTASSLFTGAFGYALSGHDQAK